MTTFIDFHALQTLPPSNINRGEDGAPKSAVFGGKRRQRISSQALKSAQRRDFKDLLDDSQLGIRTKQIAAEVADRVIKLNPDVSLEDAQKWAANAFKKAGLKLTVPKTSAKIQDQDSAPTAEQTGYLVFIGNHQLDRLAEAIVKKQGEALSKKEVVEIIDTEHAVDVSLFGRMLADDASLNVDAAVQTAHAIGVTEAQPDFDFFTAVDDVSEREEETGAGMMGTIEMMSSTFYRYSTLNIDQLVHNLGDVEATLRAVEAYARTFIQSLPTGYQNSFAAHTLPDVVSVAVRKRPVSYVNAFELAIKPDGDESTATKAGRAMAKEAQQVSDLYGYVPSHSWYIAPDATNESLNDLGESTNFEALIADISQTVAEVLNDRAGE